MPIVVLIGLAIAAGQDSANCGIAFLSAPTPVKISTFPQLDRERALKIVIEEFRAVPDTATARVLVSIATDRAGKVVNAILNRPSQNESIDSAALRAARRFSFTRPGTHNGQPICAWVTLPLSRPRESK